MRELSRSTSPPRPATGFRETRVPHRSRKAKRSRRSGFTRSRNASTCASERRGNLRLIGDGEVDAPVADRVRVDTGVVEHLAKRAQVGAAGFGGKVMRRNPRLNIEMRYEFGVAVAEGGLEPFPGRAGSTQGVADYETPLFARASRAASSNGVRSRGTSARMRSSFATVGFRRPSTSGRATSARVGVTSSIQRAESHGVRSGTSTRRGKRPLIRPTR